MADITWVHILGAFAISIVGGIAGGLTLATLLLFVNWVQSLLKNPNRQRGQK